AQGHVGYYLVDRGLAALEQRVGPRGPAIKILRDLARRAPLTVYLGSTVLLLALLAQPLLRAVLRNGMEGWAWAAIAVPVVLISSQLAISLVNWLMSIVVMPRMLPRMDYSRGLPPAVRTLVVVPAMLTCAQDVGALADALEVRFLANRDPHLHFA
ncbi:glycosyltransferase 36, partial [mine drainage metagenome]